MAATDANPEGANGLFFSHFKETVLGSNVGGVPRMAGSAVDRLRDTPFCLEHKRYDGSAGECNKCDGWNAPDELLSRVREVKRVMLLSDWFRKRTKLGGGGTYVWINQLATASDPLKNSCNNSILRTPLEVCSTHPKT